MDYFHESEKMLTEEIPFNKAKWKEMMKFLDKTRFFDKHGQEKGK